MFDANGIFGDMFDLNGDGKIDAVESALEFAVFNEIFNEDSDDGDVSDFDDDIDDFDGDIDDFDF